MDNNNYTLIKQLAKTNCKTYKSEFYNYVFNVLNNLIKTDIDMNLKFVFINYLLFERVMVFFKNKDNELQVGRLAFCNTRDENLLPIDITARTIDGTDYNLIKGDYVLLYNHIPVDYLRVKVREISDIEKTINYRRKFYAVPVIFKSKDSKILRAVKEFIRKIFTINEDDICTITNAGTFDTSKDLEKIDLDIEYLTDKLLDENESLKEDILEVLGIYKNTSSNRERVNETELIISNSLTTVNKLGFEDSLIDLFKEIKTTLGFDYKIELNINKIFDTMKSSEDRKSEVEE